MTVSAEHLALILTLAVLMYVTRITGWLLGARQAPPAGAPGSESCSGVERKTAS